MAKISKVYAREILNSAGLSTVEASITFDDGYYGRSSISSGVSKGTYEAQLQYDNDPSGFGGSIHQLIDTINTTIGPKLIGMQGYTQPSFDKVLIELDNTPNKSNLGANAILSLSQAYAKASAKSEHLPLWFYLKQLTTIPDFHVKFPVPIITLFEGGMNGEPRVNFQEFNVIPASSKSLFESVTIGSQLYSAARQKIHERNFSVANSAVGGFAPAFENNKDVLSLLKQTIDSTKIKYALDVFLGIDATANLSLVKSQYSLSDRTNPYSAEELIEFYKSLCTEFALLYIEDPFSQDDIDAWKQLKSALADKIIAGDDIVSTNPLRLQKVTEENALNAVIIKPIQIGTVTEAVAVAELARYKKLKIIVSGRTIETIDDFIVDFAVGIEADYAKFGAPARERIAKYNRLLEIYDETHPQA